MKKVKICGIRREEDIRYVNEENPDYIGFVFAESRRRITAGQGEKLRIRLNDEIVSIGVFVNEPAENIISYVKSGIISMIQLHGDETEKVICSLKSQTSAPIIKAIRPRSEEDIKEADKLSCDFLLFDTYREGVYGGTGDVFPWEMIPPELTHPYFLAGGLNAVNVKQVLSSGCYGFDISSGVETDGVKDRKKIKELITTVRTAEWRK